MTSMRRRINPVTRHKIPSALAFLVLLPSLLAGCLQFETIVRVKPDGSGTITERFLMGKDIIAMFAEMAPEGEAFEVLDEAQLREDAAGYGEQVRFVSAEPLETDFGQGYVARYSFADINQLELDTDAGKKIPDSPGVTSEAEESEPEIVRFALDGANPTELLVNWPVEQGESGADQDQSEATPTEAPPAEAPDPAELEMMKEFMGGMRMAMHIEVEGEIIETNATYRDGARITLLEIAFDDLLADAGALQAMAQQEPKSLSDFKLLLKQVPALKLEVEPQVSIRFQ